MYVYIKLCPLRQAIYYHKDFICANLNLQDPRMLYAKYQCIPDRQIDDWTTDGM